MVEKIEKDNKLNIYVILLIVGFAINLVWEINQMPYFADKPGDTYAEGIFYCSLASVIDGITIVSIYLVGSKIFAQKNFRFYLLTVFFGAVCAIFFEHFAFYFKLWSYKESMPIVPVLGVGLSPFIQLITLTPLSIFLANLIYKKTLS